MTPRETGQSLIDFLNQSPCNFIAVETIRRQLEEAGYRRLRLEEPWKLTAGDRFYVTRNDSAIFAVALGTALPWESGFRIVAAHSDSPTFRIKPKGEIAGEGGITRLNTEVYGGPILYTWFDRPLSIAGRVIVRGESPLKPVTKLIHLKRPVLIIPHLAIHFNRAVNEGNKLSKQADMLPVIGAVTDEAERGNLLVNLITAELGIEAADILDFDLMLYPVQPATFVGAHDEFVASGRMDDLSMVHAGLTALLRSTADNAATRVLAIFDNEETGSGTKQGAASPVLADILRRIVGNDIQAEDFSRAIAQSFLISADNGHAFHPSYAAKYDPTNHPVNGGGPVIKINANCKYMTDAHSSAVFAEICRKAGVPFQYFVNHSDVAGGSTLGNILTSQIDIDGVDVGNPIWAMHSCCETGAVADQHSMIEAMTTFYNL